MTWNKILLGTLLSRLTVKNVVEGKQPNQPNIVFVLADDVGWADVPWNNEKIR